MKKTFKTFALMLLTALAFGSCVDVPAPYNLPDKSSNTGGGGSGTIEGTPVTCAQAAQLASALADGTTSSETYTITGYITQVVGEVSRNQQTFWMADTKGSDKVFEAYWANLPEGVSAFTVGMKVKITGKLMKYVNANNGNVTPEMKNAIVEILTDDGGGGSTTEEGTPVTCAQAVDLTNALANNATSTETYTITGYITQVVGDVSRNQQTFWMADTKDGGKVFEAYWANLPEGVTAFTVGMKVKITGQLLKYVNNNGQVTPEIKNATVVILEDDGGGGTTADEGTPVTCAQAVELANALADNATSDGIYTVTGYITSIASTVSSGKQSFYMNDVKGGESIFEAFKASLPTGVSEFVVGMKVKITGHLYKYVNSNNGNVTPEIKDAVVVILEQGDGGDTPPVGDIIDVTCAEAVQLANVLSNGGTSTDTYAVTGYITETDGKVSRNQQIIWMADTQDGGKVFEGYWANLPSGVSVLTVGMKVKMTGKLMKYVNNTTGEVTPEIKNGDIVILEQGDGGQGGDGGDGGDTPGPGPGPGGDTVTDLVNGGFEDWVSDTEPAGWKSASSASNSNLSKSQEVHDGDHACLVQADANNNKRLATQEITLAAGTYTFSYYAKAASTVAQTKCGFVPITINNGEYKVGSYKYSDFFNLNNEEWTLVSYEFTLSSETTVCLVVMNPKSNASAQYTAQDIIVDDATLVKH